MAKVDELMALCDELEAKQTAKAQTKEALNGAALHHVRSATHPAELDSATRFYIGQMDTLTDVPQAIPPIRETILQLAVQGKLVPQDPNDEPASELLKRIAAEKEQLVKDGKIKKSKPLPEIEEDEIPFEIPKSWEWVRYGDVTRIRTGKLDANAKDDNGKYPFFTCSQTPSRIDTYSFDTAAVLLAGNGDFNLKYYEGKFDAYQRTYVIEPLFWDLRYCFIVATSQIKRITEHQRGSAVQYLKLGDITTPAIPIPPFAEQHRIVAKVDELMALCDQLEARLTTTQDLNQQLTQAILATRLNGQ